MDLSLSKSSDQMSHSASSSSRLSHQHCPSTSAMQSMTSSQFATYCPSPITELAHNLNSVARLESPPIFGVRPRLICQRGNCDVSTASSSTQSPGHVCATSSTDLPSTFVSKSYSSTSFLSSSSSSSSPMSEHSDETPTTNLILGRVRRTVCDVVQSDSDDMNSSWNSIGAACNNCNVHSYTQEACTIAELQESIVLSSPPVFDSNRPSDVSLRDNVRSHRDKFATKYVTRSSNSDAKNVSSKSICSPAILDKENLGHRQFTKQGEKISKSHPSSFTATTPLNTRQPLTCRDQNSRVYMDTVDTRLGRSNKKIMSSLHSTDNVDNPMRRVVDKHGGEADVRLCPRVMFPSISNSNRLSSIPRSTASSHSVSSTLSSCSFDSQLSDTSTIHMDGYLDDIDLDTMNEYHMPNEFRDLLFAPLLQSKLSSDNDTCNLEETCSQNESGAEKRVSSSFVGGILSNEEESRQNKRRCVNHCKGLQDLQTGKSSVLFRSHSNSACTGLLQSTSSGTLQRYFSESEAYIKSAVQRSYDKPDLISDFTRPYALPTTIESKSSDVRLINCDTINLLLSGHYVSSVRNFCIIDCRYPYEYEGGHIRGSLNIYTKEQLRKQLLTGLDCQCLHLADKRSESDSIANRIAAVFSSSQDIKHTLLVFHCEFSSERGPNMFRYLRAQDRKLNHHLYPFLYYPEMYLLIGGYKEFFASYPHLCIPMSYRPMNKTGHEEDLRHFRSKSKSWSGVTKGRSIPKRIIL